MGAINTIVGNGTENCVCPIRDKCICVPILACYAINQCPPVYWPFVWTVSTVIVIGSGVA